MTLQNPQSGAWKTETSSGWEDGGKPVCVRLKKGVWQLAAQKEQLDEYVEN